MDTITLKDVKRLRVERHWSQQQLAEMTGLSTRTIQRIEGGQNADFETLKALGAVFEVEITNESRYHQMDDREEIHLKKLRGFYKLLALSISNFVIMLGLYVGDAINMSTLAIISAGLGAVLTIYALNHFDVFGILSGKKV